MQSRLSTQVPFLGRNAVAATLRNRSGSVQPFERGKITSPVPNGVPATTAWLAG